MADNDRRLVTEKGTGFVQSQIRSMAGRQGVQYVWWPEVRAGMMERDIDMLDVREVLGKCVVKSVEHIGQINRFVVQGRDIEERSLRVIVVICDELSALEIVHVELLEG